jgi:hypothetical protein
VCVWRGTRRLGLVRQLIPGTRAQGKR